MTTYRLFSRRLALSRRVAPSGLMLAIVASVAICVTAPVHAGKVYSWVDAQGQRHYGDAPPANQQSTPVSGLRSRSRAAAPDTAASDSPSETENGEAVVASPDPALAAAAAERAERIAALKAQNCAAARGNLAYLQDNPAVQILVPQSDGSTSRMTTEQHAARITAAQTVIRENC